MGEEVGRGDKADAGQGYREPQPPQRARGLRRSGEPWEVLGRESAHSGSQGPNFASIGNCCVEKGFKGIKGKQRIGLRADCSGLGEK